MNNEEKSAEPPVAVEPREKAYQSPSHWRSILSHDHDGIHKRTLELQNHIRSFDFKNLALQSSDWRATTLSNDEEDIQKRTLDFHKHMPPDSRNLLFYLLFLFPMLTHLCGMLEECEDALSEAIAAEQRRKNVHGQRNTKNVCDQRNTKNVSMYIWHRNVPQGVPYFCILLATTICPTMFVQHAMFSFPHYWPELIWMVCLWNTLLWCASGVEVRQGTLKTTFVAIVATTGAALFHWANGAPTFSFWGRASFLYLGLSHLIWAMAGVAMADVFLNWDILTTTVKPTSTGQGVYIAAAVAMNLWIWVPDPVAPAFFFGFSLVLPCTAHLKSSMVLGRPDPAYVLSREVFCWVCFSISIVTMMICLCIVYWQEENKARENSYYQLWYY